MALQEDDQLWEHLQGKSREELLGLLEQIMKKQPEIKGLLKLLLELPLTSGARAEHKAGVGRVHTLEQQRFRLRYEQHSRRLAMPGDIACWPRQTCIGSWTLAIVLPRLANAKARVRHGRRCNPSLY